jgi:hypothetical protein
MKTLIVFTTAAALIAGVTVGNAQSGMMMDCSKTGMMNANNSMMKMSDKKMKKAAMNEMAMAKKMMAKKDMDGCKMHMDKAAGMMN